MTRSIFGLFFVLSSCLSFGQTYGTDSHTVTVTVATINNIQISGGAINLSLTGADAVAGVDLMTVTDQTSVFLWGINSSLRKVTAQTDLISPQFTLKVVAVNPTQGTASAEFTLSTTAQDFLINLGRSTGNCSIRYTGEVLASQGTGTDAHTITFTIQNQ